MNITANTTAPTGYVPPRTAPAAPRTAGPGITDRVTISGGNEGPGLMDPRQLRAVVGAQGPRESGPSTGVRFRPIQLRELGPGGQPRDVPRERFPNLPYTQSGQLDLNRLTPDHVRNLPPDQQKQFFDLLRQQGSAGNMNVATSENSPVHMLGLDSAAALHLHRQDPSGRTAAGLFGSNPDTIRGLHAGLSAGRLSPAQRDEANGLANGVFRNLDAAVANNPGQRLTDAQTRAMAHITTQHIRANSHNLQSVQDLMRSADQGLENLPPEAQNYNTGTVMGSVLGGVKSSGSDPLGALVGLAPGGKLTRTFFNVATRLLRMETDTRGTARSNYNALYESLEQALDGQGNVDTYRGFTRAHRLTTAS